ncbi:uncharacterized protein RHOBADRAFT_42283 [Rhodotorula graminis WP1]|uniref:Uncharacterized protein n=1 Tax=Rhodotorula graminis (strain WP1) TaxID=578459 RepID=A0A194S8Z8_RHOGW|nr:uncharacterized protein RHOBADRAFT_42283 [Rhodotorula graminis WP1]KPV77072.1 hypothetical protein RHOBADRAFT_42283 [Rhodotorula graminis WP1]
MLAGYSSTARQPQAVYSRWSSYDTYLVHPSPPAAAAVPRSPATSAFSFDELDDLIDSHSKGDHYAFTPPTPSSSCTTSSASAATSGIQAGASSPLPTGLVVPSPDQEFELVWPVGAPPSSSSSSLRSSPNPSPELLTTPLSPAYPFPRMRTSPRAALAASQARSSTSPGLVHDEQVLDAWSGDTIRPHSTALRPPLLSAFSTWSSSRTDDSSRESASVGSSREAYSSGPSRSQSWSEWADEAVEGSGAPGTAVGAPWSASTALFPACRRSSSSLGDALALVDDVLPRWEHLVETVDPTDVRDSEAALDAHEAGDGFPWGND